MNDEELDRKRLAAAERGSEAAGLGRGGRMSRQRKTAAVIRLLRGEDLDTVSRALGVTAATLTAWREAFLAAGEAALATRPTTGEAIVRIPMEGGHLFRGDVGHRSDLIPATIPR